MSRPKTTSARFVIPLEVYPFDLYVSLGESDARFKQGLLRYKDARWVDEAVRKMRIDARPGVAKFGRNKGLYMIRTGVIPQTSQDYGTLQHEVFHFIERLFSDIGLPHHINYTSEAYAYMAGYLTKEIYKRLWATPQ